MKNEWDFFADVQRRLTSGQQLVRGYFGNPLLFPFDEQRGPVLDEDGTQYELGQDYKKALHDCIQPLHLSWGLCFQERILCVGAQIETADGGTDYAESYQATV